MLGARSLVAQARGAAALLELPATARIAALGGAYASVVGDEGSVFVNPAGMAPVHSIALGGSFERSPYGTSLSTAAAVVRVGRLDLGLGAMYLDLSGDSVIVPDPAGGDVGTATGELIRAYQGLAVGAVAYRRGVLSAGGSVKYVRQEIGTGQGSPYRSSGLTGDVGLDLAVFDIMAFGVVVQNLGAGLRTSTGRTEPLPRAVRIGYTLNFIDPQGTLRLLVTTDWVRPAGGDSYWAFGLEGGVVYGGVGLVGRAGYVAGRAASDRRSVTVGGGVVVKSVRLDYAYQGYEATVSGAHRFGIRWIP